MTADSEGKKVGDSFRFYQEFKEDLATIADESGMTRQKIVEDALEFYFGSDDAGLSTRRASVQNAFQRLRPHLKSELRGELLKTPEQEQVDATAGRLLKKAKT